MDNQNESPSLNNSLDDKNAIFTFFIHFPRSLVELRRVIFTFLDL